MNWRRSAEDRRASEHAIRIRVRQRQARIAYLKSLGWKRAAIVEDTGVSTRQVNMDWADSLRRVSAMSELEIILAEHVPPPHQMETTAMRALELRKQGWNYRRIGNELEITPDYAATLVMEELKRIDADEVRSTDKSRRLMIEQLDELLASIWPRALRGELEAMLVALKFLERRAKLIGLDAPQTVDIEMQIRRAAAELDIDPDEAVLAAQVIVKNQAR